MYSLLDLPYDISALSPVISATTLEFHHGKHLQSYIDNLNKLIEGSKWENMPLRDIVAKSDGTLFNNAGQVLNHNLYFEQFRPVATASSVADGSLAGKIKQQWGSLDAFKAEFEAKGIGIFGSGWVWLSADVEGNLVITQESGAGNPVTHGYKPILTFDVWEHAYYLDYQNRRAAHLKALWQIVDWNVLEQRYKG